MNPSHLVEQLSWIDQVAAIVWVGITGLLILSIFLLSKKEGALWQRYSYHVLALIVMIWLYPLYTFGFSSLMAGLLGNIAVAILGIYTISVIYKSSAKAALLVTPVVIWLAGATFYVVLQLLTRNPGVL